MTAPGTGAEVDCPAAAAAGRESADRARLRELADEPAGPAARGNAGGRRRPAGPDVRRVRRRVRPAHRRRGVVRVPGGEEPVIGRGLRTNRSRTADVTDLLATAKNRTELMTSRAWIVAAFDRARAGGSSGTCTTMHSKTRRAVAQAVFDGRLCRDP
jgi:hypothetical protein